MLTALGDDHQRDPILFGGGRVFDTNNGPFFEYTEGLDTNIPLKVYATHLGPDIGEQFKHLLSDGELESVCAIRGVCTAELWRRKARGTYLQRAECVVDIGRHFGWHRIDDDPQELTEGELRKRWFTSVPLQGQVTTAHLDNPVALVPEMLLALHGLDPMKYWQLFQGPFPIIPSEALRDWLHPWWQQHGKAAQAKIVQCLRDLCPQGFVFEVRDGHWGFWANDRP